MSNEKPKRGNVTPPPGNTFGIGPRPRNWLVPVILLSLREWNSYGYELMQRASAFGFEASRSFTVRIGVSTCLLATHIVRGHQSGEAS